MDDNDNGQQIEEHYEKEIFSDLFNRNREIILTGLKDMSTNNK